MKNLVDSTILINLEKLLFVNEQVNDELKKLI